MGKDARSTQICFCPILKLLWLIELRDLCLFFLCYIASTLTFLPFLAYNLPIPEAVLANNQTTNEKYDQKPNIKNQRRTRLAGGLAPRRQRSGAGTNQQWPCFLLAFGRIKRNQNAGLGQFL